ncbi:hypothetical protein ACFVU3_14480 [Streptomyces sp. NPDC058052]|uniref:hypothetical protein n=1 Tax=Streptomyces sp. NPDC058052 TaxID=3346316 RepID=UPI0036E1D624
MSRKGESRGAELPPGWRRTLQQELIGLQRRAGRVSQAEIARSIGKSKSTVSNVFSGPLVQQRDTVIDIALMLADRLPAASGIEREALLDDHSTRFRDLWDRAKSEEDAVRRGTALPRRPDAHAVHAVHAPQAVRRRSRLPEAVKQLLFSLTLGCAVCTWTGATLGIHRIVGLSVVMGAARRLGGRHGSLAAAAHSANPWELIVLCPSCNRRASTGDLGIQELRERRLTMDRHPDAPKLYGRYLDQILLSEDRDILDLNAVGSAMAIAQREAPDGERHVLRQGPAAYSLDRQRGATGIGSPTASTADEPGW